MPTLYEEAIAYHQQWYVNHADDDYLLSERGLLMDTIIHFKLGRIYDPLSPNAFKYKGAYTIPYLTTTGRVIELRARLRGGKVKYLNIGREFPFPDRKTHLFNAAQAMPTLHRKRVYIVEGEFDAMIAWQCGLKAVSVPGASQWQDEWAYLFEHADVVVAYDGDEAGQRGAAELERKLSQAGVVCSLVTLPSGDDLTDLYLRGGSRLVRETLGEPAPR